MSPTKPVLRFAKLTENAYPPLKGSAYAAGWDLRRLVLLEFGQTIVAIYSVFLSAYDYVLLARGKITALTDIQIAVPDGCYGRVGQYSDRGG